MLLDDLKEFHVNRVWTAGELTAEEGRYLPEIRFHDISSVKGSVVVKDFSKEKFKMHLKSGHVHVIGILPGGRGDKEGNGGHPSGMKTANSSATRRRTS